MRSINQTRLSRHIYQDAKNIVGFSGLLLHTITARYNIKMSDSSTKQSSIYDINNASYANNSPYAISAFPRTMVCFQLNTRDGSPNVVINQQLCHADDTLHTNTDGVLFSASGFAELLIQLQGLEMIFNTKKNLSGNLNDLAYSSLFNIDLASALLDLNQLKQDIKPSVTRPTYLFIDTELYIIIHVIKKVFKPFLFFISLLTFP